MLLVSLIQFLLYCFVIIVNSIFLYSKIKDITLATKVQVMTAHGKIGPFNTSAESWASYTERLNYYFLANDIKDEKKHSILLTLCGPQTFQLLRSLVQLRKLEELTFQQRTKHLAQHYNPTPSQIIQRFKFHTRERGPSETVAAYVAELKAIASHCGFKDSLP